MKFKDLGRKQFVALSRFCNSFSNGRKDSKETSTRRAKVGWIWSALLRHHQELRIRRGWVKFKAKCTINRVTRNGHLFLLAYLPELSTLYSPFIVLCTNCMFLGQGEGKWEIIQGRERESEGEERERVKEKREREKDSIWQICCFRVDCPQTRNWLNNVIARRMYCKVLNI